MYVCVCVCMGVCVYGCVVVTYSTLLGGTTDVPSEFSLWRGGDMLRAYNIYIYIYVSV